MQPVRLVLHNLKRWNRLKRTYVVSKQATWARPREVHVHPRLLPGTVSLASQTPLARAYSTLLWTEVQPYNAIRIRLKDDEKWDSNNFTTALKTHLKEWKAEGRSGVWLHIPINHCALIKDAVGVGFSVHHSQRDEVALCVWLDDSRPNKIPHFADHQVGVCGVVIRDDTKELLVTQDKYKPARWKFPGGLTEHAESIANAVVREVFEETGVVTEFQSVIAFRQHHHLPMAFDQSDLYFICRMKPLSFDIMPCIDEVLKCQWIGIKELQLSPHATQLTNRIAATVLQGLDKGFQNIDITMEEWPSILPGHTYQLFLPKSIRDDEAE